MQSSAAPGIELQHAQRALDDLRAAATLEVAEECWKTYLRRLERCWSKAENHFRRSPKWQPWRGEYVSLRRDDPLLAYLVNARGAEEHTVAEIVERTAASIGFDAGDGGDLRVLSMQLNHPGDIRFTTDKPLKIRFRPERLQLLPIVNRGVTIHVPTQHKGEPIDPSDLQTIGQLGMAFYRSFLKAAEAKFVTPPKG